MENSNSPQSKIKIYDPGTGRAVSLVGLIEKLGTLAVAERYGVKPSTVYRWKKGLHRPARYTITKSSKKFF